MLQGFFSRMQTVLAIIMAIYTVQANAVTLVENGKPLAVIVTDAKPTIAANLSALELQYHVEAITGAVLPIQTSGQEGKAVILVGESERRNNNRFYQSPCQKPKYK